MATETAILAGGCFWGMQELLRERPGVVSTRVGYSGGDVANATYRNHGTHAEAVEIVFDPAKISGNVGNLAVFDVAEEPQFFYRYKFPTKVIDGLDGYIGQKINVVPSGLKGVELVK